MRTRFCRREGKIEALMLLTDGALLVDGLANDVQNAPQGAASDGHLCNWAA